MPTISEAIASVNRVWREFKRYTGDGFPGEPANAPLPVGDQTSGVQSPKKSEIRGSMTLVLGAMAQALQDVAEGAVPDGGVSTAKVQDDAISEPKLSGAVRDKINGLRTFAYKSDFEAAVIPDAVTRTYMPRAGVELVAIGAPSPVKPWHLTSDNGRYFDMRFPDGKISLHAWAGSDQGLDGSTNDSSLFKYASEYIDRAWWATAGGAAQGRFQRGCIFVPPGLWTIDPADPLIAYDYMRLIGVGDGQSMISAFSTGPGALVQRPSDAAYNSNQRTTRVEVRGMRFIATGNGQTMLDLAHCGRMRITENQFSRQDRIDDWNNAKQVPLVGTVGVRLRNSGAVLVGGDVVKIDNNYFYWMDTGILSGDGSGVPGPETTYIGQNEISDCPTPIVINNYGGAGGTIENNTIQRWADEERAIDLAGRRWDIGKNYMETEGNTVPPILFRTGCDSCNVARKKITNYTDHMSGGVVSLGTNDGSNTRDEYGTVLGAGAFSQ